MPGMPAFYPLAIAPLADARQVQATQTVFRSDEGRLMPVEGGATHLGMLRRVPWLHKAQVLGVPYILEDRLSDLQAGRVEWLVGRIAPTDRTPPGTYRGSVRLMGSGVNAQIPLTVRVLDVSMPSDRGLVFGLNDTLWVHDVYPGALGALSPENLAELNGKLAGVLLKAGFNSLGVYGPIALREREIATQYTAGTINVLRREEFSGPIFFSCYYFFHFIDPSSPREEAMRNWVRACKSLASRAGADEARIWVGNVSDVETMKRDVHNAKLIADSGGQPVGRIYASYLPEAPADLLAEHMTLRSGVAVMGTQGALEPLVGRLHAANPQVPVYACPRYPFRNMLGFVPAFAGCQGTLTDHAYLNGSPWDAQHQPSIGLVAPGEGGGFVFTRLALESQLGRYDFLLARRALELADQLKAKGLEDAALHKAIAQGKELAGRNIGFFSGLVGSEHILPGELEALRLALLEGCQSAQARLSAGD